MKVRLFIFALCLITSLSATSAGKGGGHLSAADSTQNAHMMLRGMWVNTTDKRHTLNISQDTIYETVPPDYGLEDQGNKVYTNEYQVDSTAKITVFTEDENGNSVGWLYVVSVDKQFLRIAHDEATYHSGQYLDVYKRQLPQGMGHRKKRS